MRKSMRKALPIIALGLAACETTNSDDWVGGDRTPFNQAERSCEEQTQSIREDEDKRDFFIGCMTALGWTPKPGATVNLPGDRDG